MGAPRFDSRSAFARLLDPEGGHFSVAPVDPAEVERRYLPDTLVLETTFRTAAGAVRLTDALALGAGSRGHELGHEVPHAIVRRVEGIEGRVAVRAVFRPRLEYGLVTPRLAPVEGGVRTEGGPDGLVLRCSHPVAVDGGEASVEVELAGGDELSLVLHHAAGFDADAPPALDAAAALADTAEGWRSWQEMHADYEGPYRDLVRRSALVLQALTYQPTGAIVAAPTTSLPEKPGGDWNWDYRFAWLRDASFVGRALQRAACANEAQRWFGFMARAAGPVCSRERVQIAFGIGGEHDLSERTLDHLAGHAASAPVRTGNKVWRQQQLDVPGYVLDAAWQLREELGELEDVVCDFLCTLADHTVENWDKPDAGIWEDREGERDYVPSKALCWVALDRAVKLAPQLGPNARPDEWATVRDTVRDAVWEKGWDEDKQAWTGAFGSDHLDAAVLLLPLLGFLPADHPRSLSTLAAVQDELGEGGLLRRWTEGEDEGFFLLCTFWAADALARAGRIDDAREAFDRAASYANDLGLLAEMADGNGGLLGNFPQALSHVGLINAAASIAEAEGSGQGEL